MLKTSGVRTLDSKAMDGGGGAQTAGRFTVSVVAHRHFGGLVTLAVDNQPLRRLTREESLVLGRALAATVAGVSVEKRIYMSPIASDQDFDAAVEREGIVLTSDSDEKAWFDWSAVVDLAGRLAQEASPSAKE
ncbi:MAG: hypothetical protein ACR65Z_13920 [Methylocystis sp.]